MITITIILMLTTVYILTRALNPLKMSMMLMIFSATAFLCMSQISGTTWLPMLFFMLFMGGILIVFMIISSVLPNEKMLKLKKLDYALILLLSYLAYSFSTLNPYSLGYNMQMKWMFNCNLNIALIMALIVLYFLVFVKLVSNEKMSLRSEACQAAETL